MDSNSAGTMNPSDRYPSVIGSIHHILDQSLPRHVNRQLREAPPKLKKAVKRLSLSIRSLGWIPEDPESASANRRNSAFTANARSFRNHSDF